MAVNWKGLSYHASMRLWHERIQPDPSLPHLPLPGIETIIGGLHETYNEAAHVLISLVDNYFHHDIDFRSFAFTDIGENLVDIINIAPQFTSHIPGMWTADDLYEMWTNLVKSDRNYIDENAAKYGYFLDIFIAFPTFETLDLSKRRSYVSNALNLFVRCHMTRQGLQRPSVQQWLDYDGHIVIKWCLDEVRSPNVDTECRFTLHQTLLAFYGLQSAKFGYQGDESFDSEQHILIARMLERVSAKHKYTEAETIHLAECLRISQLWTGTLKEGS